MNDISSAPTSAQNGEFDRLVFQLGESVVKDVLGLAHGDGYAEIVWSFDAMDSEHAETVLSELRKRTR